MSELQLRRRDAIQIAYHWINFLAIVSLSVSGLAIYFGFAGTADYFAWHLWAAWVLLAALVVHIWHDTVTLKRFERMWISRADIRHAVERLRQFRGRGPGAEPKHGHYKVEQIAYHWMLAIVVLGLVITGLILWKPARILVAPFWIPWGWDAVFAARILHDVFTFLLLALIAAHVYFAVAVPKNWYVLKSIFNGRVRLNEYAEHHRISARLQSELEKVEIHEEGGAPIVSAGDANKA